MLLTACEAFMTISMLLPCMTVRRRKTFNMIEAPPVTGTRSGTPESVVDFSGQGLVRWRAVLWGIVFLVLLCAGRSEPACAAADIEKPKVESTDSTMLLIPLPFFSKLGLQTGFVNTKDMDTGLDFGALVSKDIYRDFIDITTLFHLWGATNDTLDVATAGIDGEFLYKIPIRTGFIGFGGFILSCDYINIEKQVTAGGVTTSTSEARYRTERFITGGIEVDIKENRTMFVQLKYGVTDISTEFHVLFGLNFYTRYKKFSPWLAPPLIRD
jgi:hypothetical protein